MNTRIEQRARMVRATLGVCDAYAHLRQNKIPAFEQSVHVLRDLLGKLDAQRTALSAPTGAATVAKKEKRLALVTAANLVLNTLEVYAYDQGNSELLATVKIPRGKLWNGACQEVVGYCQHLAQTAREHRAALDGYLPHGDRIGELEAAIAGYAELIEVPRAEVQQRKLDNAELHELVDRCVDMLNQRMDKLIVLYLTEAPDLVKAYWGARVIGPVRVVERQED